ncbi:unnamed protein product [Anisakis simplex]|uniref:PDEase domain-containing protein n=1 Tax=Anisakis simplex TaxID=6269 RepID=A0A0M3J672_ANISI|nr:unnamed protein product [Anisakis simplex]
MQRLYYIIRKAECVEKRTILEEQHLQRTNDRVNEFKRVVNILNEDLDFESAQEAMYDGIACDISMTGKPLSRWCEFVLEHVSAEMHEEINVALRHMKKFFILNSDENFKACKYLLFVVVDDHLNNNDVKTWQEMRFAYCNLISEALKHKHIDKLLLPYLFTADQRLTQSEIAHTALTSVFFIFLQSGFSEVCYISLKLCIWLILTGQLIHLMNVEEVSYYK